MSSSVLRNILAKPTNPAILPIPPRTTGNNVPKSLHKTRRFWRPNVTRSDWPVSIPAAFVPRSEALAFEYGESSSSSSAVVASGKRLAVKGVKMQMRRRKDVEKAGGIEGLLLSRPSKHLTPFGKHLRSALFDELHRIRATSLADKQEIDQATNDAPLLPDMGSAGSLPGAGEPILAVEEGGRDIPTGSGR